jgi:glycoprotein 2-beta-D-xylosyltransferase
MQRVTQPAVVVTRFEYANLFHTVTDWYSAYMTSRIAKLKKRPRLIFVDGHCKVTGAAQSYYVFPTTQLPIS